MSRWHELYWQFADEDLAAAVALRAACPRLALYFAGQAIEKWLKAVCASTMNFDNPDAAKTVLGHQVPELVQRIAHTFAARMGIPTEYLARQPLDALGRLPARVEVLNRLRYPRWNAREKRADDWFFTEEQVEQTIQEARGIRAWLDELKTKG